MARRLLALLATALIIAGCGGGSTQDEGGAPSQRPPVSTEGTFGAIPGLVEKVRPSVVTVVASLPHARAEGSGVIWDEHGIVVTNSHVVEGAREVRIQLATGERLRAKVRATDPRTDLAVLEVDRDGLPEAMFSKSLPAVGELALALGNPLGFENSVTAGIVSGLDREIPRAARPRRSWV